jgi:hypothetical protein
MLLHGPRTSARSGRIAASVILLGAGNCFTGETYKKGDQKREWKIEGETYDARIGDPTGRGCAALVKIRTGEESFVR